MKNKLTFLLTAAIVLLPTLVFAAETPDGNYSSLLQFLKGDGAFEKWFMQAFTNLDTRINSSTAGPALLGRSIGGVGALIYLGYMGWQMIAGDREWEITPMLRPMFIGLILIYWSGFVSLIQSPFNELSQPGQAIFSEVEETVNDLRIIRFERQQKMLDAVIKMKSEQDAKSEVMNSNKKWWEELSDSINDGMDKLIQPVIEWQIRMEFQFQKLLAEFVEFVCLAILRICVYVIFFIQKIWTYILIMLGPIAVGMALIPGFENSLYSWVSKFINVNLYTFVAYTIINIGQQLIASGYTMEIERYDTLLADGNVKDMNAMIVWINNSGMLYSLLFTCVAYIVTGIGVLMTPTIADSIVSAGGAGAMTKMKQAAGKIGSSVSKSINAAKAAGSAAAPVAGAALAAGGAAAQKIKNTVGSSTNQK